MKPGDVLLVMLPVRGGGPWKLRPALFLCELPGSYQTMLLCGISTRFDNLEPEWDEQIVGSDPDFVSSRLHQSSTIRPSYLFAVSPNQLQGKIGQIADERLTRIRGRLSDRMKPAAR